MERWMLISRILQKQGNLKLLYIPPTIWATYTKLRTARISIIPLCILAIWVGCMLFLNKQIYTHRRNGAKCTQRTKYYCIIVQSNKTIKWNKWRKLEYHYANWCKTIQTKEREGGGEGTSTPRVPQHNIATKMRSNMWKESNQQWGRWTAKL